MYLSFLTTLHMRTQWWLTHSLYWYSSITSLAVEKANLKLSLIVSATLVNAFLNLDSSSVKKPNTINTTRAIIHGAIDWQVCVSICGHKHV